jgi:hypothetical protein
MPIFGVTKATGIAVCFSLFKKAKNDPPKNSKKRGNSVYHFYYEIVQKQAKSVVENRENRGR